MANEASKVLGSFKAQAANGAETGVKKTDMFRVPPQDLKFELGFNERDYDSPECKAQIEAFASAYLAAEFVPPLVVRVDPATGDKFVVEGHQRTLGALKAIERGADLTHLDCIPFRGNDIDRIVVQCRSERGLKLTPLGLSKNFLKLHRKGLSNQEIAVRMDVSSTHVEAMLKLATAGSDVHQLINDGVVAATVAIEAVKKYGDAAGGELKKQLEVAKASGKTKVKASAVREWAPPRKATLDIYRSITPVFEAVAQDAHLREMLQSSEAIDPSSLEGKSVNISAAVLIALCRNFQTAERLKAKRSSKIAPQASEGAKDASEAA